MSRGPVLLEGVEAFDAQYSDGRENGREAAGAYDQEAEPSARASGLAALKRTSESAGGVKKPTSADGQGQPQRRVVSAGHPEIVSGELLDPKQENHSSSFPSVLAEGLRDPHQQNRPSELDRDVAVEALTTLRERRFGSRARVFDATVVAMVTACTSAIDGDRAIKLRAQLDAIEHAFSVSRGAPSPSYIWGSVDHFLAHEASGRRARLETERARAVRAREAHVQREGGRESRQRREECGPPPEVLKFIERFGRGKRT